MTVQDVEKKLTSLGRLLQTWGVLLIVSGFFASVLSSAFREAAWQDLANPILDFFLSGIEYPYMQFATRLIFGLTCIAGGWGIRNKRRWSRFLVLGLTYLVLLITLVSLVFTVRFVTIPDIGSDLTSVLAIIICSGHIVVMLGAWTVARFLRKRGARQVFDGDLDDNVEATEDSSISDGFPYSDSATSSGRSRIIIDAVLVALVISALIFLYSQVEKARQMEGRALQFVANIRERNVQSIAVYDEYRTRKLNEITMPEAIEAFGEACRDVEQYELNHPTFINSRSLTPRPYCNVQIELHCQRRSPDQVFGGVAVREGGKAYYQVWFKSEDLGDWFDTYVLSIDDGGKRRED